MTGQIKEYNYKSIMTKLSKGIDWANWGGQLDKYTPLNIRHSQVSSAPWADTMSQPELDLPFKSSLPAHSTFLSLSPSLHLHFFPLGLTS